MALVIIAGCSRTSGVGYPRKVTGPLRQYFEGKSIDDVDDLLRKSLESKPQSALLHYGLGDVRYLLGDFESSTESYVSVIDHASTQRDLVSDILIQNSISTMEAMARYVPGYEEKLAGAIEGNYNDLYRNSDGGYFSALAAKIKLLRRQGKFEEAGEAGEREGCFQSWLKTGPFGGTELMGFDKVYPPEVDLPWKGFYKPRKDAGPVEVQKAVTETCWTSLGTEGLNRGGTFYGITQMSVSKRADVSFKLASFGSTVLLIDGVEIVRIDRRKDIHPNSHIINATLEPGIHNIVVKISARSPSPSFTLLWKESASSKPQGPGGGGIESCYPEAGRLPVAPPPSNTGVETYDLPDTEIGRLLLTDLYMIRGIVTEAKEILKPLVEEYPDSFTIGSREMILEALDSYVPFSIRFNRTKAASQSMKKHHKEVWLPYIYLSQFERQSGRFVEAIDIINSGAENSPHYPGFIVELADLYDELGWSGESIEALKEASRRLEGTCFVNRINFMLASKFNDLEKMEEHARLGHACDKLDRTYINILVVKDKWDEALEYQQKLLEAYRDDRWLLMDAGWSLFKLGDVDGYKKALLRSFEENPDTLTEALRLADLNAFEGDEGEAEHKLFQGIARTGGPPSFLHQKMAVIGSVPYLFHYRRSFEESVASFNTVKKAAYGDTPAIEVLDHVTHRVFKDGSSLTRYHSVKKLLTREGVEKNGEFKVPETAVLLKIHTMKPDGTVLEPEKIFGKPTVSYPSLKPGDFTETEWVQYMPPSTIYPGGTFLDRWYFQVPDLVLHRCEMYLIAPADMELDLNPRGSVPTPKITEEDGMNIYKWEVMQSPHIKYESDSPSLNEFLPSLQVTRGATWESYEEWIRDLLIDTLHVTPEMKRTLEEILEEISEDDTKAKTKAIYRWVSDEIQDEEGLITPVSYTFHERRGNKIKLFYSLLTAAGIPAELHVAETLYADKTPSLVPDFNRYTHFIVFTGGDWLMPVYKKGFYGFLPYQVMGQKTKRIFPGAGEGKIPSVSFSEDALLYKLRIEVNGGGESICTLTMRFTGTKATLVRGALRNIPKGELKLQIESTYLAEIFTGATLTSLSLPDLDDAEKTFNMIIEFTKPPQGGPIPGSVVIGPLLKSKVALQWTQLPYRNFPLLIDDNVNIETHIEIDGTGKWKIMSPPKPEAKADLGPAITFQQTTQVDKKAGKMTLDRRLRIPAGRLPPSKYVEFQTFANKVDEAEGGVYLMIPLP